MDGSTIARALADLEEVLNHELPRSLMKSHRNGLPAEVSRC
jgi:hypothetical protein